MGDLLRRRWALALVVALIAAIAGSWLLRPSTHTATPRPTVLAEARLDQAQTALTTWIDARAASPDLAALQLEDLGADVVAQSGAMQADGSWAASARLTWAYGGADPRPVTVDVTAALRTVDGAVTVEGVSGPGRVPLWLTQDALASRTPDTLVLTAPGIDHRSYARWAADAVRIVHRTLPSATGVLVVEVPASEAALDAELGADAGTYANVAAVTASVDGSQKAGSPVHVFVNPEVLGKLESSSAQIVMSHEATHALTGAALDTHRPLWLAEGFADYVALRDVRVPLTTSAGQIIAQVRSEGLPAHLPDQADFDAGSSHFGASYEAAWLATSQIAADAGPQALVDVYDAVGRGVSVDRALREHAGDGLAELTRRWRSHLRELAGN